MREHYPNATGPIIVHRLDMSTSGLMVIAKNLESYQKIQSQFTKRKVKKKYLAILDGSVEGDGGEINLPLRVDLDNRPHQLVCYQYGKPAKTIWQVIERKDNRTKIIFMPITGRTHQLRVHAAHQDGLNASILGDDIYGRQMNRLHLQAIYLEFLHPSTFEVMKFELEPEF
jgi:tRNA pseudouridine32 synthase/23S rRNA pseudouridine746 synthase